MTLHRIAETASGFSPVSFRTSASSVSREASRLPTFTQLSVRSISVNCS